MYIASWKAEPYFESFTNEEVLSHLVYNKDFLYVLIEESTNKLIGFVGGRPIAYNCNFFLNEAENPIDIDKGFYIDELGIEQSHKKNGWGLMLMQFLICSATEKGFHHFVLRTHATHSNPAIGLYYKLGFKPRTTQSGNVHGVIVDQQRIGHHPDRDFRIYFYKEY